MNILLFFIYGIFVGLSGIGFYFFHLDFFTQGERFVPESSQNLSFIINVIIYPIFMLWFYLNQVISIRIIKFHLEQLKKFDNLGAQVMEMNNILRKSYNNALMLRQTSNFLIVIVLAFGTFMLWNYKT